MIWLFSRVLDSLYSQESLNSKNLIPGSKTEWTLNKKKSSLTTLVAPVAADDTACQVDNHRLIHPISSDMSFHSCICILHIPSTALKLPCSNDTGNSGPQLKEFPTPYAVLELGLCVWPIPIMQWEKHCLALGFHWLHLNVLQNNLLGGGKRILESG